MLPVPLPARCSGTSPLQSLLATLYASEFASGPLFLQLAVGLRAMPHEATAAGLQMAAVNLAQRVA